MKEGTSWILRKTHNGCRRGANNGKPRLNANRWRTTLTTSYPRITRCLTGAARGGRLLRTMGLVGIHAGGVEADDATFIGSISEPRNASLRPSWAVVRERCGWTPMR